MTINVKIPTNASVVSAILSPQMSRSSIKQLKVAESR